MSIITKHILIIIIAITIKVAIIVAIIIIEDKYSVVSI